MNYCTNCGNKVDNNAFVCTRCGAKLKDDVSIQASNSIDNGGFAWSVLGFFVPLAGLILYLVWKNEKPKTAKSAGKGALAYLIFYIIIVLIAFIFGFFSGIVSIEDDYYYDDNYYHFE